MCVCVRERETLLSACKQLYSTSASITPLFNSNHTLTRLQCHATTGPSTWVQGLGYQAPPIQHHQARHLGPLLPGSSRRRDEGSGILDIHSALASASPIHRGDEAHE